jgi:hypothetical protein
MSLAVHATDATSAYGFTTGYYGSETTDNYKGAAKFIPDIWSGKLQVKFYTATCLSEVTNNDWEGEIKDVGDKVIIRSKPDITIRDYEKGMKLTAEVPQSTPLELLIDKGKYFMFVCDDVDKIQSDVRLMDAFSDDAGEQMKIKIENVTFAGVLAGIASSNKGNSAGAISTNIALGAAGTPASITKTTVVDYIVDMGLVLDEANVPENGRFLVIPAAMAARIKKSDLKDASVTGDGTSMLRNGRMGTIDRFTLYSSNNLPKSGAEYTIFGGTKDGLSFASQMTKMETLRSTETFGNIVRGLNVFGFKVTKPEALVGGVVTMG